MSDIRSVMVVRHHHTPNPKNYFISYGANSIMTCFQDIVQSFDLTPYQVAAYLWRDAVFSVWDGDCEYLESLTPEQLKAFAEIILAEASMKEEELAA